jgi:dihydroorotase
MTLTLTLTRPDDWHLHLRDGDMLAGVLPHSRHFARAIVMPNLVPPVVTAADARAYRDRIRAALPAGQDFTPLMTLYLTETTDPADVAAAQAEGLVTAVKLYPAGATTNSASGVRDIAKVMPVLERMAAIGLPLCVHGEVTDPEVDIFDREAVFIERVLDAAPRPPARAAHHHGACHDPRGRRLHRPRAKPEPRRHPDRPPPDPQPQPHARRRHPAALLLPAGGQARDAPPRAPPRRRLGRPRFFLGTDSAPHARDTKECACGCAGVFTAPNALACLAHVFEAEGALDRLEGFASLHGPAWYGLPPNPGRITLERSDASVPYQRQIETGDGPVVVFDPGFPLHWRVKD